MRKLFLICFFIFLFSACQTNDHSFESRIIQNTQESQNQTVSTTGQPLEGILKQQTYTLDRNGTHVLEDEMGARLIYLQSKKISLNKYLEAKVKVEGVVHLGHNSEKILDVEQITLLDAHPGQTENTDQTNLYRSENLGITLNLPSNWKKTEDIHTLKIFPDSTQPLIQIEKIENKSNKKLNTFVEEKEQTDLTLSGFESIRTMTGDAIQVYVDPQNQNIYKINFNPLEKTATEKTEFYNILKSFALNQAQENPAVCQGAAKIPCPAGYRCEVESQNEDATGICVKIEDQPTLSPEELNLIETDVKKEQALLQVENSTKIESKSNQTAVLVNADIDPISEDELEQGFYYAQLNQKKPGTPDFWVHSGEGENAQWHLPKLNAE